MSPDLNLNDLDEEFYIRIKIDFQDRGIGIAKENQDKLFIDFNKLDDN